MSLFSGMDISASGLTAQRLRMDLISSNIANMNTNHTEATTAAGNPIPYRRQMAVFSTRNSPNDFLSAFRSAGESEVGQGVSVTQILEDESPFKMEYDPESPEAAKVAEEGVPVGYVRHPNVNIVQEMIDMLSASRSYEANVTAFNASKAIAAKALEIGKG
ncbi:flagellar basal-body rod protein FlgC [Syntrophobotulus glycolicus DSM 8271]|uniref:Flagellar basal-body rod protein FlgC n=1 Tax=Syntrophobotulus glycolicus (strain DSM 8271 / FlGlyR) TaxID=645991 RepID=F0SZF1_SYNGF|nr:flagellar basal body rod protein FlgC [Syntrophobotulus glycolicus]ADY54956.1 flagellar basal-body rod protein FlgC [Syntrophobotulus glycolicus DSM 8271]